MNVSQDTRFDIVIQPPLATVRRAWPRRREVAPTAATAMAATATAATATGAPATAHTADQRTAAPVGGDAEPFRWPRIFPGL